MVRELRACKPYIAARRKKEYQFSTTVPENRREDFSPHLWQHYCPDIKANIPKKLHLTSYLMLKRQDDFTLRLGTAVTAMWNQHKDERSHQWNRSEQDRDAKYQESSMRGRNTDQGTEKPENVHGRV